MWIKQTEIFWSATQRPRRPMAMERTHTMQRARLPGVSRKTKNCFFFWLTLQRYSQSRRSHGSRPFHDFDWYNSCGTEKCPLAVNGSCWQEQPSGGFWAMGMTFWERLATNSAIHKATSLTVPSHSMTLPGTIPENLLSHERGQRLEQPLRSFQPSAEY